MNDQVKPSLSAWRALRFALRLVATLLSPVLFVALVAAAILASGPVSLAPVAPELQTMFDRFDRDLRIELSDAVLAWDAGSKRLLVRVVDARLRTRKGDGETFARVPELNLDLNGRALLSGRLQLDEIALVDPEIHVVRDDDGEFLLQAPDGSSWSMTRTLSAFGLGGADSETRLTAKGASFTFADEPSGIIVASGNADLTVTHSASQTNLSFAGIVEVGEAKFPIGLGLVRHADTPHFEASINFRDVRPGALAPLFDDKTGNWLRKFDVPVAGTLDALITPAGELGGATLAAATGGGQISLPETLPRPITVSGGWAMVRLGDDGESLVIEGAGLEIADGPTLSFAGGVGMDDEQPWIQGDLRFGDLRAEDLKYYWPVNLGRSARDWVTRNIVSGRITDGQAAIDLRPGDLGNPQPRDDVAVLTWQFEDVVARYFGELPLIHDARGTGRVSGRIFALDVASARIDELEISEGRLRVDDLVARPPKLDVALVARGSTAAAFRVADRKPLGFASMMRIDPESTRGQAAVRVKLRVPLSEKVRASDVTYSVSANVQDYGSPNGFGGYPVGNGDFALSVDGEAVHAHGGIELAGVPAEFDWRRPHVAAPGTHGGEGSLRLKMRVNGEQRRALGVKLDQWLRGPIDLVAVITDGAGGESLGSVEVDLASASLSVPEIRWYKASQVPARLQFEFLAGAAGGLSLSNLRMDTADLAFSGALDLDRERRLRRFKSGDVRFGDSRVAIDLQQLPDGVYRLDVAGDNLDLRDYAEDILNFDGTTESAGPPVDLSLRVASLQLTDDVRLTGLRAAASRRNAAWRRVDSSGAINGGPPVRLRIEPDGSARDLDLVSGDAGAVARVLGFYPNAVGGRMRLRARLPDAGSSAPMTGNLRADDFRVINAPVLAQILSLVSLSGPRDLLTGEGIRFARLDVPFEKDGRQIRIVKARAVGPSIGLTTDLTHDLDSGVIDAEGMIVPAYTINSVLGRIPLLGNILVGRAGEGVFAFTFEVQGNVDRPKVIVNPLSALTPGFIRAIIQGLDKPAVPDEIMDLNRERER
jgi:hypothetical protein